MDKPCPTLLLDNQLCFAVYTASRLTTQAYAPILEPLGLTYPQYLVMLVLWETDGVTVSQIGKRLLLDSGTLSPLLKKLEQKQLVTRERQATDERSVLLRLTKQGKQLKSKAMQVPEKIACIPKIPLPELAKLKAQLEKLTKAFAQE